MDIEEIDYSTWEAHLPAAGFDVFHTPEALDVVDRHAPGRIRLFAGFRGNESVGLFPIWETKKFGHRILSSPSLGFGIARLGPVLMPPSPKRHKQEATNKAFIEAVLEAVQADKPRSLVRFACSPRYDDPRPFVWQGFSVTPLFTYRLDLSETDSERLLRSFSRDLRRNIRKQDEENLTVRLGGVGAAEQTYRSMKRRYRAQGLRMPLGWEYVEDLIEKLPENRSRVYVAESDSGEFVSGMTILYSNDTAYFWKGGAKAAGVSWSPNTLLHWRVINDIIEDPALESVDSYDFYTANNERLVRYKSKYGGRLSRYYLVESNNFTMELAKKFYRLSAEKKLPDLGLP